MGKEHLSTVQYERPNMRMNADLKKRCALLSAGYAWRWAYRHLG